VLSYALDPSDAVVVTGFWRSGTTWLLQSLAQALDAKGVFEPLHYDLRGYAHAVRQDCEPLHLHPEYLSAFMPFMRAGFDAASTFNSYVRSALTGGIAEPWVLGPRIEMRRHAGKSSQWRLLEVLYRLRTALRTQVVTKFVRGHLLIPALHQTFDPVLIHIRRDPRSVAASFHRRDWPWYKKLSLEEQLLDPEDGRSSYFSSWADLIRRYDREDPLVRVAAYWALLERFVDDLPPHPRRTTISYEALCLHPRETLRELGNVLHTVPDASYFDRPSRTTEQRRRDASIRERILSWQDALGGQLAQRIERVIVELELSNTLYEAGRSDITKENNCLSVAADTSPSRRSQ
jgi:hypothetical protein